MTLSDNPCPKTENLILNPLIAHLECAAEDVDHHFLLEKLVHRAHLKWKKMEIDEETEETKEIKKYDIPVDAACALVYICLNFKPIYLLEIFLMHTRKIYSVIL